MEDDVSCLLLPRGRSVSTAATAVGCPKMRLEEKLPRGWVWERRDVNTAQ